MIFSGPTKAYLCILNRYITCRPDYVSLWNRDGSNSNVWRNTHERLFECCESVWKVVKDILCVDSPEGHVSEDSEDNETEVDAKDLLSFSWRALREARYSVSSRHVGFR